MNGPHVAQKSWIPAHRVLSLTPTATSQSASADLAALNRPEVNGHLLLVKVGSNPSDYYTVEFRQPREWDRNIGHDLGDGNAVLIHRVTNGRTILQTAGQGKTNAQRLPGDSFTVSGPVESGAC